MFTVPQATGFCQLLGDGGDRVLLDFGGKDYDQVLGLVLIFNRGI
ncbi:MAG: hypothetical protein ACLFV6_16435 [Spirulinaceae cyanobacterium]